MLNIGEPVYRTCLLTWSEDQNIALTSTRVVYVCHLKGALHKSELSSRNEPMTEFTTATLPNGLGSIDVGITLPEHLRDESKAIEQPVIRRYYSRKYIPDSQGTFRMSQWTPSGCSVHGGCLLTCLTNGDHVILFAPPPVFGYQWRKIKLVSDALHDYWKSHCYGNIQSSSDNDFYELERRRRLMAITSFVWLPGVARNHDHSTVVMVITTETSHVVFIRCVFDLLQRDINCTVDHVIQLPAQSYGWGCKLACMQHQDDIFVSIGCFNGGVYLLIVGGAERSFAYTDCQLRPVIDSYDNIPVTEMTWERISKPSTDHCILVVAKSQIIFVVRVPLMGGGIDVQGIVQGHVYPTSGLASLPGGHFVSCSRDKSVLEFSPLGYQHYSAVGMATNIKATPLDISITGQPIGIATSHNGLFVAVAEMVIGSRSFTHAHCKIHFIKLATQPNELIGYFENMVAMETPMYMCWDVFELLRQLLHADNTLDVNSLLTPAILNGITGGNKYCLQLAKMIVVTAGSCDREEPTVNNLSKEGLDFYCTINHVTECLSHWVNEPDVYTDVRDVDIVNNMLGWLRVWSTASDTLGEDVQFKLKRLSCMVRSQLCPVCGMELNWTAYNTLECPSQHRWNSCHITCTVLGRYNGRRCTQCGACILNGLQERKLLLQQALHICLRCGGLLKNL